MTSGGVAIGMVVDTHVHVIDPVRFPLPVGGGGYIPHPDEAGTAEELAVLSDGFGITHQVIVQPSGAGTDNRATLDAVARARTGAAPSSPSRRT
jgi:predicted TIM-barrel fold metal-dependent hydrolase